MGSAAEAEKLLQPFNDIPALASVQGDVSYTELLKVQGTGSTDPTACSSNPLLGSTALLQTYNVTSQREIYNLFNTNAVLTENTTYRDTSVSGWRIPTSIAPPRFMKFSLQLDF